MKKRIKLFSSALALGMLLGTGVGPITQIVQTGHRTTMIAQAATGAETRLENTVELEPEQITLTINNYIKSVAWNEGDQQKLLNGGTLIIPAEYRIDHGNMIEIFNIAGVADDVFSKENLGGGTESDRGIKKVIFENPENIKYIGQKAFKGNQLTEVKLPNVKEIRSEAFADNRLKSVIINENYELDDKSSPGTVNNPTIFGNAFWMQKWEELDFDYQPTISADELLGKLNITFIINKVSADTRITVLMPQDANNITIEPEVPTELKVNSTTGGTATVELFHGINSTKTLAGSIKLTVNAQEQPTPSPGGNGGNNGNESGTNPDTGNGGGNNGNETKPQPAPKPEEKRPHTVYAKRGMRLHRNVSLTNPIRSYKKQSRTKAPSFRVRGVEYDKNGKKRYKVDGGYITAGSSYVADSHFRSNKVRQVRVLSNRVNSYKDVKLSSNKKVRSYKKGTKLRVKRVVNWGRATRFELTNGRYITGNKQLLIMDQK